MNNKLKDSYEKIVMRYIKIFCKKQGLEFDYWVGDRVGEIAAFGCIFYFNFENIRYDIDTDQPKGLIIDWLHHGLDGSRQNYYSYSKGLRV
jgi:hypothetical protein